MNLILLAQLGYGPEGLKVAHHAEPQVQQEH
jgi:hypothetical protein